MEEVTEGLGKGILRFLKWIVINAFIEIFLYGYGYITLKLITLGKYPKQNQDYETLCSVAGFISLIVSIAIIMFINTK